MTGHSKSWDSGRPRLTSIGELERSTHKAASFCQLWQHGDRPQSEVETEVIAGERFAEAPGAWPETTKTLL